MKVEPILKYAQTVSLEYKDSDKIGGYKNRPYGFDLGGLRGQINKDFLCEILNFFQT